MNANIIFIGGTGHHALLSWLVCQSLCDRNILKENIKLFFIDSDRGTDRVDSIYKRLTEIGYNGHQDLIVKRNIPAGVHAKNTLRDYLEENHKTCDEIFFDEELLDMDVTTGFHGYPIVGATAAMLEFNRDNVEEFFKNKENNHVDRIIIVGSSIGGTGSGIGPALKQYLHLFKKKWEFSTKIVMISYIGYLETVERDYGVDLDYPPEDMDMGQESNGDSLYGDHGNYRSNSDAAMAYYSRQFFYDDIDEVAFVGTPREFTEYRTDDGLKNQNDRCTLIHLIIANLIDHYLEVDKVGNDERKCKIFQVNNRKTNYAIAMGDDFQLASHKGLKNSMDYYIRTKIARCLEIAFYINKITGNIMEGKAEDKVLRSLVKAQEELGNTLHLLKELDEMFRRTAQTISKDENSTDLVIESDLFRSFESGLYEPGILSKFLGGKSGKDKKFNHFLEFYKENMRFTRDDYRYSYKDLEVELLKTLRKNRWMREMLQKRKLGAYDETKAKTMNFVRR